MKITICDICKTDENVTTRSFSYEKRTDSDGVTNTFKEFDLCLVCYCSALEATIKEHIRSKRPIDQYRHNAALIKWIERQQMARQKSKSTFFGGLRNEK